jgi:hypothetical protein
MKRLHVLGLIALTALIGLASVSSADAAPTDPFQWKSSFGRDLNLSYGELAVNRATGNVFAVATDGNIHQFDASGNPVDFPATGSPMIPAGSGNSYLVVDNSGGATQGNIYFFFNGFGIFAYYAYNPDGSPIGQGLYFPGFEAYGETYGGDSPCGGGVDSDGHLWFVSRSLSAVSEVSPTGVPTGRQEHLETGIEALEGACALVFDDAGNAYMETIDFTDFKHHYKRYDAADDFAYTGDLGVSIRFVSYEYDVDPATHDFFVVEDTGGFSNIQGRKGSVLSVPYTDPFAPAPQRTVLSSDNGIETAKGLDFDATGQTLYLAEEEKINVFHREPPSPPRDLGAISVKEVRSEGAVVHSSLTAGGAPTTYRFEYGTDTSYGDGTSEPRVAPLKYFPLGVDGSVSGLRPNTTYHLRMSATNSAGTTYGPDRTFTTYAAAPGGGVDPCPNALARKQTSAQRLPDCRAYELVSAADTGGYDVESYLAPGQTPFQGFPLARDRVLYATHSGAVPGPWNATNRGPDPYLATRTANGWVTNYMGLPADIDPAAGSFSSTLGEADQGLTSFAFAGAGLCSPCFGSGLETGIPLRLPDGELVQGMTGSLAGSVPASAKPEGKLAKYFSEDGKHLLFASKYAFEPGANSGGDLTVYDRNLATGTTQIASTDGSGAPLTGTVSELDVSANGSRIVTAKGVSTDSQGNEYVHPYMHIGSSSRSVDLAPAAISGVLYAGMTSDGSKVFFVTADKLSGADDDTSADLYEAAVDGSGNLSLSLVTPDTGATCDPVANSNGSHWNTTGSGADCDAVAISAGGGVASQSGAVYFLSPESFGGEGIVDQPNLYLAQPGGSPSFVATLEPDNPLLLDSVKANATRRTGDFQTTPSGSFAAFVSTLELGGVHTFGLRSVFRYDAAARQIDCGSCDRTETDESNIAAPAELPPNGLGLLADGRLFFTTSAQLVINDANRRKDVYVWSSEKARLISGGSGPFDSGLLSASADGADVFFFTRDALAPEEDRNGALMRIYDAREGGGFFKLPPSVPCAASDECHGPGTAAAPAPPIRSSGKTTAGNVLVCAKNRVKKRGQCVKKTHQKKAHKKKHAKKRNTKTTGKRGGHHA